MATDNYGPGILVPVTDQNISPSQYGVPVRNAIIDLDARLQDTQAGLVSIVRKLNDETVTNSITLHQDSELILPVLAGQVYALDGFIMYSAPIANDINVGWAFTVTGGGTAGTCLWTPNALSNGATTFNDSTSTTNHGQFTQASVPTIGGSAASHCAALPRGIVFGGTQDGTIIFRFCQGTAGAGTSAVVFTGSWFSLTPMA